MTARAVIAHCPRSETGRGDWLWDQTCGGVELVLVSGLVLSGPQLLTLTTGIATRPQLVSACAETGAAMLTAPQVRPAATVAATDLVISLRMYFSICFGGPDGLEPLFHQCGARICTHTMKWRCTNSLCTNLQMWVVHNDSPPGSGGESCDAGGGGGI